MEFLKKAYEWLTKVDVLELSNPTEAELLGINEVETIAKEENKTLFVIMPAWEVNEFISNCNLIGTTPIKVLTSHVRQMNLDALEITGATDEEKEEKEKQVTR